MRVLVTGAAGAMSLDSRYHRVRLIITGQKQKCLPSAWFHR